MCVCALPAARSAALSLCACADCSRPPPSSSRSPPDETTHSPGCAAAHGHTHSSSHTRAAGGRSAEEGEDGDRLACECFQSLIRTMDLHCRLWAVY